MLKSTDDFIERVKQFPCNNPYRTVSFDVSLFTNVPISETTELIIDNRLYEDGNPYAIPFDKDVFHKLMNLCTTKSAVRDNVKYAETAS